MISLSKLTTTEQQTQSYMLSMSKTINCTLQIYKLFTPNQRKVVSIQISSVHCQQCHSHGHNMVVVVTKIVQENER